jgi:hypothetical protein
MKIYKAWLLPERVQDEQKQTTTNLRQIQPDFPSLQDIIFTYGNFFFNIISAYKPGTYR